MVDIRQLRYFVTVARQMHFSRAADQLHIAQPSLSQNIRQLEEELGVVLLERTSRSVTLTAAGAVFYDEALRTLDQMSLACRAAQRTARGEQGRLAIGFVTSAIMGDLRSLIQRFAEQYPTVELSLRELLVDTLVEQLHAGALDLICSDGSVIDSALEARAIKSSPWVLAVHKSHALARRHSVELSELAHETFIFATNYKTHNLHDMMLRACREAGFAPKVRHYADSVPAAVSMVSAKLGVAMVYELAGFHPPEVVYKKMSGCNMDIRMQMSWRRGELTPTAANFLALIA